MRKPELCGNCKDSRYREKTWTETVEMSRPAPIALNSNAHRAHVVDVLEDEVSLPWFRMYAEWATDPVVQSLAFEDQRHHAVILCLKCNGTLDRDISIDQRERIIVRGLGLDQLTALEAKRRLLEVGLIDEDWQPRGWDKRQYSSDVSTDRVRKHRKEKESGNVPETLHGTEGNSFGNVPEQSREEQNRTEELHTPGLHPAPSAPRVKTANCPTEQLLALYHETLPMCPRVQKMTDTRERLLRARWREHPDIELWRQYFAIVRESKFLTGKANGSRDRAPFLADFEWLIKPGNFAKVMEGKYDNR